VPGRASETVELTIRLKKPVYAELEGWTNSLEAASPEEFLALFVNALMADQALRERVADTYLGGA
jgi:hypothetical protein